MRFMSRRAGRSRRRLWAAAPAGAIRGRNFVHLSADRLHRRQRAAHREPRGERDHHQHHRQPDDEQPGDGFGGVGDVDQRAGHQDGPGPVGGLSALRDRGEPSLSSGVSTCAIALAAPRDRRLACDIGARRDDGTVGTHHLNDLLFVTSGVIEDVGRRTRVAVRLDRLGPAGRLDLIDQAVPLRGDNAARRP